MPPEKQFTEVEVVLKGELIAILNETDSLRTVSDIINHKDSFEWLFVTTNGKTFYKSDVSKLPSEEFPVIVISTEHKINQ